MELARQHNGHNNGQLQLARSWIESRGWRRPATVRKLVNELLRHGLIVQTRHGGLNNGAHWYAVTWLRISDYSALDIAPSEHRLGAYLLGPSSSIAAQAAKQKRRTPYVLERQAARTPQALEAA